MLGQGRISPRVAVHATTGYLLVPFGPYLRTPSNCHPDTLCAVHHRGLRGSRYDVKQFERLVQASTAIPPAKHWRVQPGNNSAQRRASSRSAECRQAWASRERACGVRTAYASLSARLTAAGYLTDDHRRVLYGHVWRASSSDLRPAQFGQNEICGLRGQESRLPLRCCAGRGPWQQLCA